MFINSFNPVSCDIPIPLAPYPVSCRWALLFPPAILPIPLSSHMANQFPVLWNDEYEYVHHFSRRIPRMACAVFYKWLRSIMPGINVAEAVNLFIHVNGIEKRSLLFIFPGKIGAEGILLFIQWTWAGVNAELFSAFAGWDEHRSSEVFTYTCPHLYS